MTNLLMFYDFMNSLVGHVLQSDLWLLLVMLFVPLLVVGVVVALFKHLRMGVFS